MKTFIINIKNGPKGKIYKLLVDYATEQCEQFLLVIRPEIGMADTGKKVLDALNPYLLEKITASQWPGTKLMGGQAIICYYKCSRDTAKVLKEAVAGLFSWVHPNYPEDLCFLKANRIPWLTTIAHEQDGYFEIDSSAIEQLERNVPGLKLRIER